MDLSLPTQHLLLLKIERKKIQNDWGEEKKERGRGPVQVIDISTLCILRADRDKERKEKEKGRRVILRMMG